MSDTNANSAPALPSQLQSDGDVGRPSSDTLDGQPSPKQNDDVEAQIEKEKIGWKASARHMIRTFSSLWFTLALDAGVLSIVMHNLPYPSHWIGILSTIMFVIDVVLYVVIGTIFAAGWILYWEETKYACFQDAEEIALLGAPVIAWFTITGQVALTCSESWGYRLTVLSYVMWWIGAAWILFICSTLYICIAKSALTDDEHLPTAVFLPIVGIMTAATMGGLICNYGADLSASMAVPVIVCSYLLLGYGLFLAFAMYAAYLHRLIICGWPPANKIPGMILTIGPMGQSATAFQNLGNAAVKHKFFESYDRGFWLQAQPAAILQVIGVLLGLLLLGFACFWIFMAYFALIQALINRELHFSLTWWSTIFPMGTVATACENLGDALDSSTFKVLACIILVFLMLFFIGNTLFTVPMILSGRVHGWKLFHRRGKHQHGRGYRT